MKASELKSGMAVRMDGQLYVLTACALVTPGNLRSFMQVKLKGVTSGQSQEKRLRSNEEVERVALDRREIEYLYSDSSGAVFMDNETFEQFSIPSDVLGDSLLYIKPNSNLTGLVHEDKVISVELPGSVNLLVTDTTPQVRGATATNQLKEAEMETGLKTRVPPFIEVGEMLRISTATGEYLSRASE